MNNRRPVELQDHVIKARLSRRRARRKLLIAFLTVLIVSVMIAWLGFVGWGMFELLRALGGFARSLWLALQSTL